MVANQTCLKICFNIANLALGVLFCVCGVIIFIPFNNFNTVVVGLYITIFGAFTVVFEIFAVRAAVNYIAFYFYWIGRALWFIFIAVLCLVPDNGFRLAVGVIGLAIGFFYIIFYFLKIVAFPEPLIGSYRESGAVNQRPPAATAKV